MPSRQKHEMDLTPEFNIIHSTDDGQNTPKMVQMKITDWMMPKTGMGSK